MHYCVSAHRRLQGVSSGVREDRRYAELRCGTAAGGIVPPLIRLGTIHFYWDVPVSWLLWQMPAGSTHIHWLSRSRKGSAFLFVYLLSDRVPLLVKLVRLPVFFVRYRGAAVLFFCVDRVFTLCYHTFGRTLTFLSAVFDGRAVDFGGSSLFYISLS